MTSAKAIALCMNTPGMADGDWQDRGYGKRFPGAGWMRHLALTEKNGEKRISNVWCGQTVLEDIKKCHIQPENVIVIQEERNAIGQDLVGMGADPRVLLCLESPIYTPHFYDNIPMNFKHRLLFDGGTEHVYFPSFDEEDLKDPVPWTDRNFLCMVTANKHYSMLGKNCDSPSYDRALKTQLQDYRYEAIEHFSKKTDFHLFGRGWERPSALNAHEISDKLGTIRNYKFALCFENGAYPGYVTEKIVDCLVAGVIPVYLGAPDIVRFVPSRLFIDGRQFGDFAIMERWLRDHANFRPPYDNYWEQMAAEGQEWLRSGECQQFNNRIFAKRILELCQ